VIKEFSVVFPANATVVTAIAATTTTRPSRALLPTPLSSPPLAVAPSFYPTVVACFD